jgi:hypothetical protein
MDKYVEAGEKLSALAPFIVIVPFNACGSTVASYTSTLDALAHANKRPSREYVEVTASVSVGATHEALKPWLEYTAAASSSLFPTVLSTS